MHRAYFGNAYFKHASSYKKHQTVTLWQPHQVIFPRSRDDNFKFDLWPSIFVAFIPTPLRLGIESFLALYMSEIYVDFR